MMEWIVTSTAMILIVIALRGLLKGKISLKLQYGLWALVLVRLLLPFSIVDSAISITNILSAPVIQNADEAVADYRESYEAVRQDYTQQGQEVTEDDIRLQVQQHLYDRAYSQIEKEYVQSGAAVTVDRIHTEAQQQVQVISLAAVITEALPYFWVAGMIAVAAVLTGSNLHFWWKLRQNRKTLDIPGVPLRTYLTDYVATPCLFGLVKPDIYLTNEVLADSQMRRHVLAHEMSHYRQGDHVWSVLRSLCLVLHWYNPLVWVAAVLSKQDAELACDEATIKTLGETERTAYGRTLIGMTCVRRDPRSLMLTATTMLGTKKTLKERIALIAKKPKTALYTLIACVLVAAIAVGCTFTGMPIEPPATDPTTEPTTEPTEPPTTEPTTEPTEPIVVPDNTWAMDAVLVNDKGEVLEKLELTAKVMIWEQEGRAYYSLGLAYPEGIYNSGGGPLPYPESEGDYTCCFGVSNEAGKQAATCYIGFDPVKESFIVDFDDGEDIYLIAYRASDAEISALWDHFRDFLTMVPGSTTTEPPVEPVLNWELPDYPQLSYGEYFSETRYYYYPEQGISPRQQYFWGGWRNGKDKCEVWMEDGKILAGSSLTGKYVQVGTETYENTRITCCDEFWIYAIKDRTELFRIDYNGENRQTLYVDETQKIAPFDTTYTHVRDNSVLFFVAAAGSDYGIYRLYLPDMTLDLLYTTESKPFLYEPYSNYEITWSSDVEEVVNNVYEIDYYYNCLTGQLLDRPVYGDRSWGNTTWAWWLDESEEPNMDSIRNELETQARIMEFQNLLTSENGYWYWRALGCVFEKPEDISLYYLFYNGLPVGDRQDYTEFADNEVAFLKDVAVNSTWRDESAWVNAHKMPRQYIDDMLHDYFGISIEDVTIPEEWSYFDETDSYYYIRSDAYGVNGHTVTDVQTDNNGLIYVYWTTNYIRDTRTEEIKFINEPQMVMVLEEQEDGGYLIHMNMPVEELLDTSDEEYFQNLLTYENGYWYWRAMGCVFEKPDELSLEYLFYNGLKYEERQESSTYTDNEVAFLKQFATDTWDSDALWKRAHKLPRESITDVLSSYFSINLEDVSIPENWAYFEETDSYYFIRMDAYGIDYLEIADVQIDESGIVNVYWTTTDWIMDTRVDPEAWIIPQEKVNMLLKLQQKDDGSYIVLSNLPVE